MGFIGFFTSRTAKIPLDLFLYRPQGFYLADMGGSYPIHVEPVQVFALAAKPVPDSLAKSALELLHAHD